MKKWVFLSLLLIFSFWSFFSFAQDEGLIINEVSSGASGNGQYVELLLVGCPSEGSLTDEDINTVDIGGWIIDDESTNGTGNGQTGHIRFNPTATFWDAIPVGALIVIYNPNSINTNIASSGPDDNIMGDQILVLPITATDPNDASVNLFETTTHNAYTGGTYSSPMITDWTAVMNFDNAGDAIQTRDPNEIPAYNTVFHGVRWGTSTLAGAVDETAGGALNALGETIYFNGNQNYRNAATFTRSTTLTNETPGDANPDFVGIPFNGIYITNFKTIAKAGNDAFVCGTSANLSASSVTATWTGGTHWEFTAANGTWSLQDPAAGAFITFNTASSTPITLTGTPGTYRFRWTQAGDCQDGDEVNITFLGDVAPTLVGPGVDLCPVHPDTANLWRTDVTVTLADLSGIVDGIGNPLVSDSAIWVLDSGPAGATASFSPDTVKASGTTQIEVTQAGIYTFRLTTFVAQTAGPLICSEATSVTINFDDFNPVEAGPDTVLCIVDSPTFGLMGSGGMAGSRTWSIRRVLAIDSVTNITSGISAAALFSDVTDPNTTITPPRDGIYTLVWTIDIGDAGGCEISDSVSILFNPEFTGLTANATTPNCSLTSSLVGSSFPFSAMGQWALVSGPPGVTANDVSFSADTNFVTDVTVPVRGEYQFAWSTGTGSCASTSTPATVVFPEPIPDLSPVVDSIFIFFGQGLEIGAPMLDVRYLNPNRFIPTDTIPDVSYLWEPITNLSDPSISLSDPTVRNPIVNPSETTQYRVTITSNIGDCEVEVETTVFVVLDIPIPNVFTPNSDGVNDSWEIPLLETFPNAVVTVYNRWGNIVYDGTGYSTPWDGSNLSGDLMIDGTYFYIIKLNPNQTVRVSINGDGQIIREGVLSQVSGYVEIIR